MAIGSWEDEHLGRIRGIIVWNIGIENENIDFFVYVDVYIQ